MSYERRDPDDPDVPGEPTSSDVDAAFAQIVAGWDAEGRSRWSGDDSAPTEEFPAARGEPVTAGPASTPIDDPIDDDPAVVDAAPSVNDSADDSVDGSVHVTEEYDDPDDHFVPPDPPPLPRPQPATVGAAALFLLGLVLLTVPWLIGFSSQYGLPLGLLSIAGSIVWLVARLREGPPTDSGWDDGAQL